MKHLFTENTTLPEMEAILEDYFHTHDISGKVPDNLPLSREDAALMRSYLDSFVNMKGDVSAYYDFTLAIIITWIFAEKYDGADYSKLCMEHLSQLPQHHFKYYVDLFSNTLIEFNLNTFDEDYERIDGICRIIKKHAT